MTAKVSKIVIKIGEKEVELTPAEAKELAKILDEMYGEKTVTEIHEHHYQQPWHYWTTYTMTNTDGQKWTGIQPPSNTSGEVTIYCSTTGNQ